MEGIRGGETGSEMGVRSALHSMGLRFRLHAASLPGKPDIVLPKYRAVVFVNGCFWHQRSGCDHATRPKVNQRYWAPKLLRTIARDIENAQNLRAAGWRVFV